MEIETREAVTLGPAWYFKRNAILRGRVLDMRQIDQRGAETHWCDFWQSSEP
jgi:hypothetical protein